MLRLSDTGENVLRQLQIIQIQHTYRISSKRFKKKLFCPTLLRHFLLKKSDFLGIFKHVLESFTAYKKLFHSIFRNVAMSPQKASH
jgi:hypothetical protein